MAAKPVDTNVQEQEDYTSYYSSKGKRGIMILIDGSDNMMNTTDAFTDSKTYFDAVIQFVIELIRVELLEWSYNTRIGVLVYGASPTDTATTSCLPSIYELQALEEPSAARVLELQEGSSILQKFRPQSSCEVSSLCNGIRQCGIALSQAKLTSTRDSQSIWVFTNSLPNTTSSVLNQLLVDSEELNREVEVFSMKSDTEKSEYFNNRLTIPFENANDMFDTIHHRIYQKRRITVLPLTITAVSGDTSSSIEIPVELYSLVKPMVKATGVKVDVSTQRPLTTDRMFYCKDTSAPLDFDTDIRQFTTIGPEKRVYFTRDDLNDIKTCFDSSSGSAAPGIFILGFQSAVNTDLTLRPSVFIYPLVDAKDDATSSIIRNAFVALLQQMASKNVVGIARMVVRSRDVPRIVAVVPKTTGERHGFHIFYLPYADDVRPLSELSKTSDIELSSEQEAAGVELVKRLSLKGSSSTLPRYSNPVIQKHNAVIEALALEAADINFKGDSTLKTFYSTNNDADDDGEYWESMKSLFFKKRKAPTDSGGAAVAAKSSASKSSSRITVAQLREYCKSNGLPTTGKKAELQERVEAHQKQS